MEVVGYSANATHNGSDSSTTVTVGVCTEMAVRIETTSNPSDGPVAFTLTDGGTTSAGPWRFAFAGDASLDHEEISTCMFDNEFTLAWDANTERGDWQGEAKRRRLRRTMSAWNQPGALPWASLIRLKRARRKTPAST